MTEPLIKLQPGGVPPVVNYNVPEPVSYDGTHIIELEVDPTLFLPPPVPPLSPDERQKLTLEAVAKAMLAGFSAVRLFPNLGVPPDFLVYAETVPGPDGKPVAYGGCYVRKYGPWESQGDWVTEKLRALQPGAVWENLRQGRDLAIIRLPSHRYDCRFLDAAPPTQRLGLIEHHRLSSFLGAYGAGRTVNTFTLLPGEKARITIKTYKRTVQSMKQASSIFDSLNDTSSSDFEETVQEERSDRSTRARMDSWHVEGELTGNWVTGKAKIEAGYKGSASSSREQFARGVENSLAKHASKASNRRDVKVEQSTETTADSGDENVTEREVRNINVGRTLNFVFRQMNQEFITVLHMLDVRVGYTDGLTTRVASLYQLDDFLREVLITKMGEGIVPLPEEQQPWTQIKRAILDELATVFDYAGNPHQFVEKIERRDKDGNLLGSYHRVKKGLRTEYKTVTTGTTLSVDGIVLSAMYNVLRTEGIITEALLGESNALDDFSKGLQDQTVQELRLRNDLLERHIDREVAAQAAVLAKNKTTVAMLKLLYPPPPVEKP